MTEEEIEALLGRELTDEEVTNLDLYLNIASDRLVGLLCSTFQSDPGSGEAPESRRYEAREGYSTVFTDIFHEISSVTIDGETTTDYEVRQGDNLNGTWFNSLVFPKRFRCSTIVTVSGHWGFAEMPDDLKLLWARLFDSIDNENSTDSRVQSQRIDDAQVSYRDESLSSQFVSDNKATINKYSICGVGMIRHGKVKRYGYWHERI